MLVPTVTDRIDAAMIAGAGDRLGLIANFGAGIEHIDLAAARARKIIVTNTPGVFTDDTADMTHGADHLGPAAVRRGRARMLHEGKWQRLGALGHARPPGRRQAARRSSAWAASARRSRTARAAFGLEVAYHNRHRLPEAIENMLGARFEPDLDALVAEADILTLHCPASAETHQLLDARRIALMKPDRLRDQHRARRTDRRGRADRGAAGGRLAGAGLDVYSNEPAVDPRLLDAAQRRRSCRTSAAPPSRAARQRAGG